MLTNHVGCHYVVTSVTFYRSAVVDLTRSKSVHAVEHDPCCPDPTKLSASECRAVHYGLCSPLLKLPAFSIPPLSSSSPPSPATPKGTPPFTSTPSSPVTPKGNAPSIAELLGASVPVVKNTPTTVGSPVLQLSSSPVVASSSPLSSPTSPTVQSMTTPVMTPAKTQQMDMLDPVTLLAADLEGQLEALVNSFVAQDKVRIAARQKAEGTGNKSISPMKKYDKRMKDDILQTGSGVSQSPKASGSPQLLDVTTMDSTGPLLENVNKQINSFAALFEENLYDRSTSPSFKSTTMPSLKPSPEYQQTGVKAQITKFMTKEKDAMQNSPSNSLERRSASKTEPSRSGPLLLDELQRLLNSATGDLVHQTSPTNIYENTRSQSKIYAEQTQVPQNLVTQTVPTVIYENTRSPGIKYMEQSPVPQLTHPYRQDSYKPYVLSDSVSNPMQLSAEEKRIYPSPPYQKPSQEYVLSAVDYAKTRMQNAKHVNNILREEPKPMKNGHLVSDAKTKWENLPQYQHYNLVADIDSDSMAKNGHRRSLSMEGLLEMPSPSIPHPKLTNAQKQHIKERSLSPTDRHSHVPIRPFLTKGSVAERVLLFECCPDRALDRTSTVNKAKPNLISTWRPGTSDVQNKTQPHQTNGSVPKGGSLRRALKASKQGSTHIPRFYYPEGKPRSPQDIEAHLKKVTSVFTGLNEGKGSREEFGIVTKACGLPLYWKLPLFLAARGDKKTSVTCDDFLEFWRRVVNTCHDEASKFVHILTKGKRNYLISEDFFPMMQDVIESHAGLTFLKEAAEFHSRYIHTVIARIFYCVNRSWSGKITVPELRKSNFLQVLSTLEDEEDINQVTEFFSYEHFYVIYCKFWELDKDHDLFIDQNDLKLHNGGSLSSKIIQRIFSGAVTRGPKQKEGKMSYAEFVWFLISEEDKRHPRSIEYWFRCMDMDGDGFLSMYELEYFYMEQLNRLDALGIESLPFTDCLCQMLDIIKPKVPGQVSLADLKKCKMTPIFFDTFFNLEKYLDHEQRDPFASQREHDGDGPEISDWDRFAAEEYELLVAEEGAAEQQDELIYEDFGDDISENVQKVSNGTGGSTPMEVEDDDYDYAETDDYNY